MCYYSGRYGYGAGAWHARQGWQSGRNFGKPFRSVPVNIVEKKDGFELSVYAPGLEKSGITVSSKDDILTISYQATANKTEQQDNFTRREYHHDAFERSFLLNGKVEVKRISANYQDGILTVWLPKNPDTNKPQQVVPVG